MREAQVIWAVQFPINKQIAYEPLLCSMKATKKCYSLRFDQIVLLISTKDILAYRVSPHSVKKINSNNNFMKKLAFISSPFICGEK